MKNKEEYVYNEHDQNQVREMLLKQKRKKKKRRKVFMLLILLIVLIIAFFISDFSKIQTIKITGNNRISEQEILDMIPIKKHKTISLFANVSKAEDKIREVNYIKKVEVTKSIFGNVKIVIDENDPIAYSIIDNTTYIVDEEGIVSVDENNRLSNYVQRYPRINNFNTDLLKKFAVEFSKIPSQVQNEISDINYVPLENDESRCEFVMDDDKILYVRVEDMAKQLEKNNYTNLVKQYPNFKYYDFVGKYCYRSN